MAKAADQPQRGDESLPAALRRLLAAQEEPRSLRWLADELEVPASYLSRATRGVDGKAASPLLLERVATTLGVEPDWFAAVREARVIEAIKADSELRERLYAELQTGRRRCGG